MTKKAMMKQFSNELKAHVVSGFASGGATIFTANVVGGLLNKLPIPDTEKATTGKLVATVAAASVAGSVTRIHVYNALKEHYERRDIEIINEEELEL